MDIFWWNLMKILFTSIFWIRHFSIANIMIIIEVEWSYGCLGFCGVFWNHLRLTDWLIDWLNYRYKCLFTFLNSQPNALIQLINKMSEIFFFLSTDNGRRSTKQRKKFYCVADACIDKQWIVYVIFPNKLYVYYAKLICQISMKHSMFIVLSCCKF